MKKLALILAAVMVLSLALCACASKPAEAPTVPATTEAAPPETTEAVPSVAPGTVYNAYTDFNKDAGQEGVWQYYFSGDNGETFDPCGTYDDYGTVRGWHPWEGSYIGVGFNDEVPDFLEMNTDGHSTNFSNLMGTLAFEAPADGKYVLTAAVWNPWGQNCENFIFKHSDGSIIYEQDMTELVDVYGYITPTDVQLKAGDRIYIYCNAVAGDWVSGYVNAIIYYEPTDDSCYVVPEVEVPEKEEVFVPTSEAQFNAYDQFDRTACDGTNVPWVYGSTADGVTFTNASRYDEPDWDGDGNADANQWYTDGGTGVGVNFSAGEGWLEVNTPGVGSEMCFVGFKAPADGTYVLTGYAFNMWGQDAEQFHVAVNGEEVATVAIGSEPTEFSVEVTLAEGEVAYFYPRSNSEGGWVSGYLALYADVK